MLRQQLRRVCYVDAASLFGCQPSSTIQQRPFLLRACSSININRRVLSDSPATAPKHRRWVLLNSRVSLDCSLVADDAKTTAESRTSTGDHLLVSFKGAAPPSSSFLYYNDDGHYDDMRVSVVAAHADSVLLRLDNKYDPSIDFDDNDYFMYRAGAGEPPSLSLLPDRDFLTKTETICASYTTVRLPVRPELHGGNTGLLRQRGGENENDLLVVQIGRWYDRDAQREMLEFCVLRTGTDTGTWKWEPKEPVPILQDDDETAPPGVSGRAVIAVGERYLCWINYQNGFFLCDMAEYARPKVCYAPLPAQVSGRCSCVDCDDEIFRMKYSMKMFSAGASKVKLVSIGPHCCCGGPGRSTCGRSRFAFTVTTWTMDVESPPLTWVKDVEIDCEEVWALPGYGDLPRANLECPIVSLDDPNVVCFLVSNRYFVTYGDPKVWMIQLDMKTKRLLSDVQFSNDPWSAYHHLPAQLEY